MLLLAFLLLLLLLSQLYPPPSSFLPFPCSSWSIGPFVRSSKNPFLFRKNLANKKQRQRERRKNFPSPMTRITPSSSFFAAHLWYEKNPPARGAGEMRGGSREGPFGHSSPQIRPWWVENSASGSSRRKQQQKTPQKKQLLVVLLLVLYLVVLGGSASFKARSWRRS